MRRNLRMMCVFAHPDDESLAMGAAIARYAAEGVEISLVCATRGERGRFGTAATSPELDVVGRTREAELRRAAAVLGVHDVRMLGFVDGELSIAKPEDVIHRLVHLLRLKRPHVVVTFGPEGAYGHPDHIAISQFTTAALVAAADPFYAWDESWSLNGTPHRTSKLYYVAWNAATWSLYQSAFKRLVSRVDGVERQACPWPDWAITTTVQACAFVPVAWRAICCHQTQMAIYNQLDQLSDEGKEALWGKMQFYRAMSLVNGGRAQESDLFDGLRDKQSSVPAVNATTASRSPVGSELELPESATAVPTDRNVDGYRQMPTLVRSPD
jgi:LmbE family N-acetylglucosaminyl deacetylase